MNTAVRKYWRILMAVMLISIIALGLANIIPGSHIASASATVTYPGDFSSVFPNPDRGFHNRYEIINDVNVNPYAQNNNIAGFLPDEVDRTFSRAKADGDTLIHSYIHLDNYQSVDVPQELLDNLTSGLAAIRTARLKIILRVAYVWGNNPTATESQMERHMDQLSPVLTANADVIDHLEAGYLGEWGEWHDGPYADFTNQSQADTRYRMVKKLLSTTPTTLPVLIRYPIYTKEILSHPVPAGCTLPDNCQFTQTDRDRLGFHDDCFLANIADMGTYDKTSWMGSYDIPTERSWVTSMSTSYGGNQLVGGETCDSAADDTVTNALTYMSTQHWTEINLDYAAVNINFWKNNSAAASGNDPAETLFTRFSRKLGYRLRLTDATFPTSASAGGTFSFSANLQNDGYASPIQQRPVYLVLDNGSTTFNLRLSGVDVRKWVSGAQSIGAQNLTLPSNMPSGTYKLGLWLPDNSPNLQGMHEYSIQFANQNMWNATAGYNVLSNSITINGGCTSNCASTSTPRPTNSPTITPTPAPIGNSYEAEAGTVAGGAKVVSCGNCSGGNEVGYVGNGGTLQINNVSPPSAGNYSLTIYYVDGDSGRAATLSINGGAATTINFPGTGGWSNVGSLNVNVALNAGNNTLLFANPSGWAPDFDRLFLNTGTQTGTPTNTPVGPTRTPTNTPVGPTSTPTRRPTNTPVGNTPTSTPTTAGLLIDNFDGSPAWPGGNDLGHWSGANSFLNGGGSGVLSNGALVLQYNNTGTFNSDVNQNIAAYTYLVIRVSGASGGEQNQITLNFGGVSKNFGTFSGDTITTAYKDIRINLVSNGVNRTSPGSIQLLFTGGSSTIYIQKLSLQ